MIPAQILHELKIRGYSLRAVARQVNVDPGNASRCIQGKLRNSKLESKIGEILNLDTRFIWPQWPKKEKASEVAASKA